MTIFELITIKIIEINKEIDKEIDNSNISLDENIENNIISSSSASSFSYNNSDNEDFFKNTTLYFEKNETELILKNKNDLFINRIYNFLFSYILCYYNNIDEYNDYTSLTYELFK